MTETIRPTWKNRIVGSGVKPASQFKANPNNWREHPRSQREALQGVLSEVGWVQQVIENVCTGHLIDGHERVANALESGDLNVPYIQVEISPEEETLILATLDPIAAMAEANKKKLEVLLDQVSTENEAILEMLKQLAMLEGISFGEEAEPPADVEVDTDKAGELLEKWKVKQDDLWELGKHRVLCGDSTNLQDIERLFEGKKYQAVVTSPPYFLERSYEHDFTPDSARALLFNVARAWFEYCLDGGYFFDNFAGIQGFEMAKDWAGIDHCEYPAALMHYPIFREAGWRLHAERVWVKPHAMCVGLWVLSSNRPVFSWEHLWTWRKGTGKEILGESDLRCRGVWDTSKVSEIHKLSDLGHDASFPIVLPEWAIKVHSQEGDIIGEPFLGTGTTLIAAECTKRICYGMELDPKWVAVTLERFEQSTGKHPVKM